MSQFDRFTKTEYVEALRVFLNISKKNFLKEAGFITSDAPRKGRLPSYEEEPIKALEEQVNAKAARVETSETTIGERYQIARDYKGLNDAQVAREMGVSRELVRRWGLNYHTPTRLGELAQVLDVPVMWLQYGGANHLPANTHLGVRVGDESLLWREELFGLTQSIIAQVPAGSTEEYAQAYIEGAIFTNPHLAQAARKAGGRWQVYQGTMLFSPWVPLGEHGLSRRYWSDEVEGIIEEELSSKPSIYGAWEAIKSRCEAKGLSSKEFPKRISLHKRIEKERLRAEQFGVDLNDTVAQSVKKYQQS